MKNNKTTKEDIMQIVLTVVFCLIIALVLLGIAL
jgi:hypothetical protein